SKSVVLKRRVGSTPTFGTAENKLDPETSESEFERRGLALVGNAWAITAQELRKRFGETLQAPKSALAR
ncbi:MAG: hypothetical protein ABJB12_16070, partial [Pseudomonadota bacterium]